MSMTVYPSTYDVLFTRDDEVLLCLQRARDRYNELGSECTYISVSSDAPTKILEVCAVGAVVVADGKANAYLNSTGGMGEFLKRDISEIAKEAMRLLDEVAGELYPFTLQILGLTCSCFGPLECINEHPEARNNEPRAKAVLRVFDEAIGRQQACLSES